VNDGKEMGGEQRFRRKRDITV